MTQRPNEDWAPKGRKLRMAIFGERCIPATYSGFETFFIELALGRQLSPRYALLFYQLGCGNDPTRVQPSVTHSLWSEPPPVD